MDTFDVHLLHNIDSVGKYFSAHTIFLSLRMIHVDRNCCDDNENYLALTLISGFSQI